MVIAAEETKTANPDMWAPHRPQYSGQWTGISKVSTVTLILKPGMLDDSLCSRNYLAECMGNPTRALTLQLCAKAAAAVCNRYPDKMSTIGGVAQLTGPHWTVTHHPRAAHLSLPPGSPPPFRENWLLGSQLASVAESPGLKAGWEVKGEELKPRLANGSS